MEKFAALDTHGRGELSMQDLVASGHVVNFDEAISCKRSVDDADDDDDDDDIKIRIDGAADEKFGIVGGSVGVDLKNDDYSAVEMNWAGPPPRMTPNHVAAGMGV